MKVKNIMFAGFASAILSGVCGAASAADYNLVTEGYVTEKLAGKADTGASYTKSETDTLLGGKVSADTYAAYIETQEGVDEAQDAKIQANTAAIDGLSGVDGTGFATMQQDISTLKTAVNDENGAVAQKIATAIAAEELRADGKYQEKGDYALKSELPTVPTNVSAFNNDAGYLTTATADELYDAAGAAAAVDAKLSNYATTEAMNTALQGKQATIENLATIEANAAKGATAVQPEALTQTLDSYATTEAMNTALRGKQATIDNLDTIIAGANAGATAVQPGANVSVLVNDSNFQTAENVNTLIGQAQIAESQVTGLTDALAGKLDDTMTEAGTYLVQRAGDGTISYVSVEIVEETSAQE
ncbi:MAG: hypothetical protein E7009_00880 [Alphaproteobacteria bacterium]|nr:hypothetical protein [Alphaproteobacteria bacterium]